jgi:hypothetical protein
MPEAPVLSFAFFEYFTYVYGKEGGLKDSKKREWGWHHAHGAV